MGGKPARMVRVPHNKRVEYTTCKLFEMLHFCTDDDGLTENGQTLYDRVSSGQEGQCVGNKQKSNLGQLHKHSESRGWWTCPSSYSGNWCRCPNENNCGVHSTDSTWGIHAF
jgi:hypothetical protein